MELTSFETAIKTFLDNMAKEDTIFAKTYAKENKSIKECCRYITQEVAKSRKNQSCVAVTDDEVYGMAIHYYDEDDIKVDKQPVPVARVEQSETAPATAEATTPSEEVAPVKKTRKPRTKKTELEPEPAPEVDENIPVALEIPIF